MVGTKKAWPQKTSFRYVESQDLSHAEDEVTFYEEALALKRQPGVAGRASGMSGMSGMGNDSEMMGHQWISYIYDPRWVIRNSWGLIFWHGSCIRVLFWWPDDVWCGNQLGHLTSIFFTLEVESTLSGPLFRCSISISWRTRWHFPLAHGRSWALAQLHLRICWCLDQHRGRQLVNGGRLNKNISHGYHVLTEQSPTQASVFGSLLLTGDQCWGEEDGAASDAKSALRLL